jgi:hypothetical protein
VEENCTNQRGPERILTNTVRYFPILFFQTYLTLTVILFAVGPFEFPVENAGALYAFLAMSQLALLAGYLRGARSAASGYSGDYRVPQLVLWSAAINLILIFPTSHTRTGNFIPNIIAGLSDPGDAYANSLSVRQAAVPMVEYVRIFLGPLIGLLLPLTVFYWKQLTNKLRLLGVAGILGTVALFIAMGTNKAIADTVLLCPWMVFAGYKAGVLKLKTRRFWTLLCCGALAFVLFLDFFGLTVATREGSPVAAGYFPATGIALDSENVLLRGLSEGSSAALAGLDLYLTQGYYALSLSLREPFVPMFGLGNSMFLTRQAARISGNQNILTEPYPVRIEKYGWDSEALWSSIYPWIASDLSFPGTIVIVYFIGKLFALSWLDTLTGTNPFAVVMFSQFLIMLFYFPANNQLLQSGEGLTAFWLTLILWSRTRRRRTAEVRVAVSPA